MRPAFEQIDEAAGKARLGVGTRSRTASVRGKRSIFQMRSVVGWRSQTRIRIISSRQSSRGE
jgi:hypothetical protein